MEHLTRQQSIAFYSDIMAEAREVWAREQEQRQQERQGNGPQGGGLAHGSIWASMAALGRCDLFFLLTCLLGRKDMDKDWIYERCREVQAAPDGHLDLWAREHYKSTIITFGQTIRDILCNPDMTVGIFSHSRPIAKDFLSQIKYEFEHNQLLKYCYSDVLWKSPRTQAPIWSLDKGIVVRRKNNPKEASIEAWGLIDGQPTGKHFNLLVYDDVVTRDSVSSPEMIAKVTECWALSLNLGAHGGRRRMIGTRYHFNDTYREILDREAAIPRLHPATENGQIDGTPVLLSKESLEEKRRAMGPYVFGCQMLLNPVADTVQGFKREWLRRWSPQAEAGALFEEAAKAEGEASAHMNRYLLVDPAGERKQGSDYTVMLVVGLAEDGNYYLIDGIRDRLNLTARADALFRLHRKYKPLAVGYEKYGMQADIEHVQSEQERRHYRFPIIALGGAMPKKDRIRRLVPLFEQGRMYLPKELFFVDSQGKERDLVHEFVHDELLAFPVSRHDDMLDCLARITDPDMHVEFPEGDNSIAQAHVAHMEYSLYD